MKSENKAAVVGVFLCVIQIIAVFIAIFDMPYEYYQFLRIFMFVGSIILFIVALYGGDMEPGGLFLPKSFAPPLVNAFIFNPINPVLVNKGAWIFFDIVAISILLWLTVSYAKRIKNE